jgi:Iron-containing redox enzyme
VSNVASLPRPRGQISEQVLHELRRKPHTIEPVAVRVDDGLASEDLQLSLYVCYELFYRGFAEVDPAWEWEPSLLLLRAELESAFESALCERIGQPHLTSIDPNRMDLALREIADSDEAPSLSRHVERDAGSEQLVEFMVHRSAYQLKEADPHSWAIPRLFGLPKAALIEVQADEYGGGRAERIHAKLFADAMAAVGLDPTYGAYLDRIPAITLATVNLMSLCGLHRRLLGAIVGHLALFEMTSSVPNRRYGDALRRLGFDERATAFFDEHVLADAVHENIAAVDLAGGLARQQPHLAGGVLWGARALVFLDGRWASYLLDAWAEGRSSLLPSAG